MTVEESEGGIFSAPNIRRIWHNGEWVYVVVDILAFLLESKDPVAHWRVLKVRMRNEGANEVLATLKQLRLKAPDGRFRLFDALNRQQVLRLLQSVPSRRAEPMRAWLAQVGDERFEEIENPELALERVRQTYRAKGHDPGWIEERIKNDLIRTS